MCKKNIEMEEENNSPRCAICGKPAGRVVRYGLYKWICDDCACSL